MISRLNIPYNKAAESCHFMKKLLSASIQYLASFGWEDRFIQKKKKMADPFPNRVTETHKSHPHPKDP